MSPSAREILTGGIDEAEVSFEKGAIPELKGRWKGCKRATLYLDGNDNIHCYAKDSHGAQIGCDINPDEDIFTVEE